MRFEPEFHDVATQRRDSSAKKLLVGESNPGRPRDRRKCYQLHQPGRQRGYNRIRTGDRRICNPMLYHWAMHPLVTRDVWEGYICIAENSKWLKKKERRGQGARGESNPRPLAPEARIIPLDHSPSIVMQTRIWFFTRHNFCRHILKSKDCIFHLWLVGRVV